MQYLEKEICCSFHQAGGMPSVAKVQVSPCRCGSKLGMDPFLYEENPLIIGRQVYKYDYRGLEHNDATRAVQLGFIFHS